MIELAREVEQWAASSSPDGLNRESLITLWRNIGMGNVDRRGIGEQILEDAFLTIIEEGACENFPESMAYSPGGWVLKLWDGATRSAILSALMWSMLSMAGYPQLPIVVLPAVLPLLFDLKRIKLSVSQELVHASLALQAKVQDKKQNAESLYATLPEKIRDELSFLDFLDFLEACYKSGLADKHDNGDLTLFKREDQVFRLTIE